MPLLTNVGLDKLRSATTIRKFFWHAKLKKTSFFLQEVMNLGFEYGSRLGISLNLEDFKGFNYVIPLAKARQNRAGYSLPGGLDAYRSSSVKITSHKAAVATRALFSFNLFMKYFSPLIPIPNSLYLLAGIGARGNWSQVRQLVGFRGFVSNAQGQLCNLPITEGLGYGLRIHEYFLSCYGARKGLIDTALRTAESGYLTRKMVETTQKFTIRERECASPVLIEYPLGENTNLIGKLTTYEPLLLEGRYVGENLFDASSQNILLQKNKVLSRGILGFMVTRNISLIKFYSALSCENLVCQRCYGIDRQTGLIVKLGEPVGTIAGQSVGEPGTQLVLRTFHTGGVFESYGTVSAGPSFKYTMPSGGLYSTLPRVHTLHFMSHRRSGHPTASSHLHCLFSISPSMTSSAARLPIRHSICPAGFVSLQPSQKLFMSLPVAKLSAVCEPGMSAHINHQSLHSEPAWICSSAGLRSWSRNQHWQQWTNLETASSAVSGELHLTDLKVALNLKSKGVWANSIIQSGLGSTKQSLVAAFPSSYGLVNNSLLSGWSKPKRLGLKNLVGVESFSKSVKTNPIYQAREQLWHLKGPKSFLLNFVTGLLSDKGQWLLVGLGAAGIFYVWNVKIRSRTFSFKSPRQKKKKYRIPRINGFYIVSRKNIISSVYTKDILCFRNQNQLNTNWICPPPYASKSHFFASGLPSFLSFTKPGNFIVKKPCSYRKTCFSTFKTCRYISAPAWFTSSLTTAPAREISLPPIRRHQTDRSQVRVRIAWVPSFWTVPKPIESANWFPFYSFPYKNLIFGAERSQALLNLDPNSLSAQNDTFMVFDAQSVVKTSSQPLLVAGRIERLKCQNHGCIKTLSAVFSHHYKSKMMFHDPRPKWGLRKSTGVLLARASSIHRWAGEHVTSASALACRVPLQIARPPVLKGRLQKIISDKTFTSWYGTTTVTSHYLPWAPALKPLHYLNKQHAGSAQDIILGLQTIESILETRMPLEASRLAKTHGLVGFKWSVFSKFSDPPHPTREIQCLQDNNKWTAMFFNCLPALVLRAPVKFTWRWVYFSTKLTKPNLSLFNQRGLKICYGGQPVQAGLGSIKNAMRLIFDSQFAFQGAFLSSKMALLVAQQVISRSLFEQYHFQGISLPYVHFELIARQMCSCVRVTKLGQVCAGLGDITPLGVVHMINQAALKHGYQTCCYRPVVIGLSKSLLFTAGFLASSSFQDALRILAYISIKSGTDWCMDLKTRIMMGHLIPVGTGFRTIPETSAHRVDWTSHATLKDVFSHFRVINKKQSLSGSSLI